MIFKEFLHRYLPPRFKRWIKRVFQKYQIGGESFLRENIRTTPFDGVSQKLIHKIFRYVDINLPILLQVREVREILARERLEIFLKKSEILKTREPEKSAHNTIDYNIHALMDSVALDRPTVLINPILSIEKIYKNISNARFLSIGPRSEMEIFSLFARGVKLENIKAIDLFSYSPYVEVGDMHNMPYKENAFDIILLGWVLPYSKDWDRVATEIIRCISNGGIVAISADYSGPSTVNENFNSEVIHVQNSEQILNLFSNVIGKIYFRHDSDYPNTTMNMVVFEIIKES